MKEINAAIPDDLQAVIMSCLNKDPSDRPINAQDLREKLEKCADAQIWDESRARTWWQATWSTRNIEVNLDNEEKMPSLIIEEGFPELS